jgi:tripartite-type tricarboxylate transporter receptor subunit TctC
LVEEAFGEVIVDFLLNWEVRMRKLTLVIFLLLISIPPLQAQTSYYQGKTMTIVVGTVAGDLYDLYARAIALYMGKYIPGNPNIIVQNMPGAGHMIAANYIYNVAKPDGLTIAAINAGLYFEQLIGRAEVKFDWTKYTWIGNATKSPQVLYMRVDSPFKTIEDVRNAKEPPKCGTTGMSNMGYFVPKLLEETVGAKFNVVSGYQGGNEIDLAVERGEIQCRSLSSEAYFSREPFHTWRKNNFARVLVQGGRKRDERLPDAPTLYELLDKYKAPESGPLGGRVACLRRFSSTLPRAPEYAPGAGEGSARSLFENSKRPGVFDGNQK